MRVVSIHFTVRDSSGRAIDTSADGGPVTYLEGAAQIIDGLDEALRTVQSGERRRVHVPAGKAYGHRDPAQVRRLKRAALPIEGELEVGDRFQTDSDPNAPVVTIAGIHGDEVLLDANHPLAGMDLIFDVEIISARPATAEELAACRPPGSRSPPAQ